MVEEILERVKLQSAGSMDQVSTVIFEKSFLALEPAIIFINQVRS